MTPRQGLGFIAVLAYLLALALLQPQHASGAALIGAAFCTALGLIAVFGERVQA